jgi:hypothetical protein
LAYRHAGREARSDAEFFDTPPIVSLEKTPDDFFRLAFSRDELFFPVRISDRLISDSVQEGSEVDVQSIRFPLSA